MVSWHFGFNLLRLAILLLGLYYVGKGLKAKKETLKRNRRKDLVPFPSWAYEISFLNGVLFSLLVTAMTIPAVLLWNFTDHLTELIYPVGTAANGIVSKLFILADFSLMGFLVFLIWKQIWKRMKNRSDHF